MKIWYKFLFLPVLILALAGCSKDDDDDVKNEDNTPYYLYHSKDLTTDDGKVTLLQKHKQGKGIPIVILGDGFQDRDIKNGIFRDATTSTIEALFSIHPLKSLRDYFDVYEVTAVSYSSTNIIYMVEDSTNYQTAFSTMELNEDSGVTVAQISTGKVSKISEYAKKAIAGINLDDVTIIMLVNNSDTGGLTISLTYYNEDRDIPTGCSIAYVPLEDIIKFNDDSPLKNILTYDYDDISQTTFANTLLHEFGHAFAKLADEYVGKNTEEIPENYKGYLTLTHKSGHDKNVSIESDVTKTDWADFAADSRYDFENLGCYEGGDYYATGVYRPTENSIMRCTNNYFNVISRVMIYKRSMDIAYGNSWKYDYEDFVKFDLEKAKAAYQKNKKRYNYSKRFSDQPCFEKMETSR